MTRKISESISYRRGTLVDLRNVGCSEVRIAYIGTDDKVVVIVARMIGNVLIKFAKLKGTEVLVSDAAQSHLDTTHERGINRVVKASEADLLEEVLHI